MTIYKARALDQMPRDNVEATFNKMSHERGLPVHFYVDIRSNIVSLRGHSQIDYIDGKIYYVSMTKR